MPKYMLKTVGADMTAYGGFVWPTGGPAVALDWDPNPVCGNGLHGVLWGQGDGALLNWDADAKWLVVEIGDDTPIVDLDGKVKIPHGFVVHCGDQLSATTDIMARGANGAVIGSTITGGYRSIITGGYGSTITGGDRSMLIVKWFDDLSERCRIAVGYVGEDGIEANTPYKLDDRGNFVAAESK